LEELIELRFDESAIVGHFLICDMDVHLWAPRCRAQQGDYNLDTVARPVLCCLVAAGSMQVVDAVEAVTENPITALQSDVTAALNLGQMKLLPNDISAGKCVGEGKRQEGVR